MESTKAIKNRLNASTPERYDYSGTSTNKLNLSEYGAGVKALKMLPDDRLASGFEDGIVKIWDVKSGRCESSLTVEHKDSVNSLEKLADGQLVSGSGSGNIKIWNVKSATCEATLSESNGGVSALKLLSDGRLASGSTRGSIKIWNLKIGTCECTLNSNTGWIYSLEELNDGRLVCSSNEHSIKIWDLKSGASEGALTGHTGYVFALATLPQNRLTSGSTDDSIKIWDMNVGTCKDTLTGHTAPIFALKVLQNDLLVSGSSDYSIAIWDVNSTARVNYFGPCGKVHALEVLADGRLASGSSDGRTKIWDFPYLKPSLQSLLAKQSLLAAKSPNSPSATITSSGLQAVFDKHGHINNAITVPYEQLQVCREIGNGSFSVVYQGILNNNSVAIKELIDTQSTVSVLKQFKKEVTILANTCHPNIVQLHAVCFESSHFALVMEYMSKGTLFGFLHSSKQISWILRYLIAIGIGDGLAYLHGLNIIHADIKSTNVLLDENYQPKLTDFGLAKVELPNSVSAQDYSCSGTLRWAAPEVLKGIKEGNSKAGDVYSYAMVLWELGARKYPYEHTNEDKEIRNHVMQGKRETITTDTPLGMALLIAKCWEERAEDRPTMVEVVKTLRDHQHEVESSSSSQSPVQRNP